MNKKTQILKCGCVANATDSENNPVCIIHGCYEIAEYNLELLEKRIAKCEYCKKESKSSLDLPFFEYKPEFDFDTYYCGCHGWD